MRSGPTSAVSGSSRPNGTPRSASCLTAARPSPPSSAAGGRPAGGSAAGPSATQGLKRRFASPATLVGVRLRPGVAFILSGMAANAMVGRRIDLSTVAACRALVAADQAPKTPAECIDVLERFLVDRLSHASVHDVVAAALREIAHEHGRSNVGNLAERCRAPMRMWAARSAPRARRAGSAGSPPWPGCGPPARYAARECFSSAGST